MIGSLIHSFLWFNGSFLIVILVHILGFTWRIHIKGIERINKLKSSVIFAFWHEYYLPAVITYRGMGVGVLVSPSQDGELSSRVLRLLGYKPFRGEVGEKGKKAIIELIDYGKKGGHIAITPDGPKGPRRKAKRGVLHIAKRSGLPIFAASIKAYPCFRFSSWDKLMLPLPFARIDIKVEGPIKELNLETLEKHLS